MVKIATFIFVVGIAGLFYFDRERRSRTSFALWLPVIWLGIVGSRSVSLWLQTGLPVSAPQQYLEGSPLDRSIFTVLMVCAIAVLIWRHRKTTSLLRKNAPILLFFLYCGISCIWSDFASVAFKRWIKSLGDLAMVLIVCTEPDRLAAVKKLLARLAFLIVPVSILLIKYYPDLGRAYSPWTWTPGFVGVTTNKNELGMICMLLGLGTVWQIVEMVKDRDNLRISPRLIAHGTVFAMSAWLLHTAGSATSLSCFLIGSCLLVVTGMSRLGRRPSVVHVMVASMVSLVSAALFFDVGSLLKTVGRDPSLTGRTEIWHLVLGLTPNKLLGTGFQSFWLGPRLEKMWSIYWWHPNEAHNGYIETYINLGWVGVVLLAVLLVFGYMRLVSAVRRQQDASTLCLAYFVVAIIYNCTEAAYKPLNPVWIFLLLGIILVSERAIRSNTKQPLRLRKLARDMSPTLEER